jgi:hypothetical protein
MSNDTFDKLSEGRIFKWSCAASAVSLAASAWPIIVSLCPVTIQIIPCSDQHLRWLYTSVTPDTKETHALSSYGISHNQWGLRAARLGVLSGRGRPARRVARARPVPGRWQSRLNVEANHGFQAVTKWRTW